jgi:hypothetical protein
MRTAAEILSAGAGLRRKGAYLQRMPHQAATESSDEMDPSIAFSEGRDRHALDGGSRGLMLAVLEEAIQCLAGDAKALAVRRRAREAARARQWLLTRDPTSLFSFESICAVLDLEADALREKLLRQAEEGGIAALPSTHRVLRSRNKVQRERARGPRRPGCA